MLSLCPHIPFYFSFPFYPKAIYRLGDFEILLRDLAILKLYFFPVPHCDLKIYFP